MPVSKKIIRYLEERKYKFEIVEHKTAYTAWDVSQTKKVKPQEIAKALALKVDKEYVLALLASNRNLDKGKFLKVVNQFRKKNEQKPFRKIELAKEAWMKKNILGKVGAVPPFEKLIGMKIFIENSLAKNKKMYVGSGEYTFSILLNLKDYLKHEEPQKGSFGKAKK